MTSKNPQFAEALELMQEEVHDVNVANGWFDSERSVLEGHMLLVTEVAEASEAYRDNGLADATQYDPAGTAYKPEGVGSEYADILIRLLDQCQRDGIDLAWEYARKMNFNRTRSYRHGGKQA